MGRLARIGASICSGWRNICEDISCRVHRIRRNMEAIESRTVCMDGSQAPWLLGHMGVCALLLLFGVIGIFFPGVSAAISAVLSNSLIARILLLIVFAVLLFSCGIFCFCLADLIANSRERQYNAVLFRIRRERDYEDDPFGESFYEDPFCGEEEYGEEYYETDCGMDEEYEKYGWDPEEADVTQEPSAQAEADASDESCDQSNADEEYKSESSEHDEQDDAHNVGDKDAHSEFCRAVFGSTPEYGRSAGRGHFRSRFGARDRVSKEERPVQPPEETAQDVQIMSFERDMDGKGRVTLKYTRSYVVRLVTEAVETAGEQMTVLRMDVNFLREGIEVELEVDMAQRTCHEEIAQRLYCRLEEVLGSIVQHSRLELSLTVCSAGEACGTGKEA